MKIIKLNKTYDLVCMHINTRYGFKHEVSLMKNGYLRLKAKCCYHNRTWESFEFETCIKAVLCKALYSKEISKTLHKNFIKKLRCY